MKPFVKLLLPSSIEIVLSLILTFAILIASNTSAIVLGITGPAEDKTIQTLLNQYSLGFNASGVQGALGRASNLIIWAVIGAIFYIGAWLIINSLVAVRNDVIIGTRFTHQGSGRSRYWTETISRFLVRLGAAIILFFVASWTAQVWLPTSVQLFHRWVVYHSILPYIPTALFSVLGWLLILHVMVILLRLVFLKVRLFDSAEAR